MTEKKKRKKPKRSPTARSTEWFEKQGFIVAPVERHIPGCFITIDCFGFGDLLVCKPGWGTALVQVTSNTDGDSNLNAREKKARAIDKLRTWLESGPTNRFLLHAWKEEGRGKSLTATLTQREISAINLETEIPF